MDLLMKIVNRAAFEGVEPTLNPDALRWAWKLYFAADEAAVDGDGLTGG
jgi:hypothetical protein